MLTKEDLTLLQSKGISQQQIDDQLVYFEEGFPYLKLFGSASVEKGIMRLDAKEEKHFINNWESYLKGQGKVYKFVP
ncbi:MAG: DUF4301 family protein, partial [Bacteroidales bacterium]|nr:DUF4301 family protein [Bacteroidales bacterium]